MLLVDYCRDVVSYFILAMHYDDYTMVWLILTVVAGVAMVFIWFLVPETMAEPKPWPGVRAFARDVFPCCGGKR